jgi:hypothetical protein
MNSLFCPGLGFRVPLCLMVIGIQERDITKRVGHCEFFLGDLSLFFYLQIDVIFSCLM